MNTPSNNEHFLVSYSYNHRARATSWDFSRPRSRSWSRSILFCDSCEFIPTGGNDNSQQAVNFVLVHCICFNNGNVLIAKRIVSCAPETIQSLTAAELLTIKPNRQWVDKCTFRLQWRTKYRTVYYLLHSRNCAFVLLGEEFEQLENVQKVILESFEPCMSFTKLI